MAPASAGSGQGWSRQRNRRNPDLWQWLPLAHIAAAAVGLPVQDPAGPGWQEPPSVPQPQQLGWLRWEIPSMWLGQEESVTSKPLFSSQCCCSLASVHLGCHPGTSTSLHSALCTALAGDLSDLLNQSWKKGEKKRLFWHISWLLWDWRLTVRHAYLGVASRRWG